MPPSDEVRSGPCTALSPRAAPLREVMTPTWNFITATGRRPAVSNITRIITPARRRCALEANAERGNVTVKTPFSMDTMISSSCKIILKRPHAVPRAARRPGRAAPLLARVPVLAPERARQRAHRVAQGRSASDKPRGHPARTARRPYATSRTSVTPHHHGARIHRRQPPAPRSYLCSGSREHAGAFKTSPTGTAAPAKVGLHRVAVCKIQARVSTARERVNARASAPEHAALPRPPSPPDASVSGSNEYGPRTRPRVHLGRGRGGATAARLSSVSPPTPPDASVSGSNEYGPRTRPRVHLGRGRRSATPARPSSASEYGALPRSLRPAESDAFALDSAVDFGNDLLRCATRGGLPGVNLIN